MLTTTRLEQINKIALRYFLQCFGKSKQAQNYVFSRVSKETAKRFFIGYAPPYGIVEFLNKHDIHERDARACGIVNFDVDGNAFPRFSNRVMIPIIQAGRLLGFGGRILGDKLPKYLNSKTSILYNKRSILYGLHQTRPYICKRGFCFIVEGYFDVLTPFDRGLRNCVATCGTALTREQVQLLKRYTKRVYLMYDGDAAGIKAIKRSRRLLEWADIYAGKIILPNALDPASYIAKHGITKLKRYLRK